MVYQRSRGDYSQALYGCHPKSRRRSLLRMWQDCGCSVADQNPPRSWLAGRYVAVYRDSCGEGPPLGIPAPAAGCSGALQLVDLRSGRRRQPELAGLVSGLLLTARGALAFVDAGQLKKLDRDGQVTIDPGTGIDPESLASDGRHL